MATQSGIAEHSKENNNWFVFSVDTNSPQDGNNRLTIEAYMFRHGINFKKLEGSYAGTIEQSYIVNMEHYNKLRSVIAGFDQCCILLLENHKHGLYKASLDWLADNKIVHTGYLRSVPREVALKHSEWTHDITTGKWFIVTDHDETRMNKLEELGLYGNT